MMLIINIKEKDEDSKGKPLRSLTSCSMVGDSNFVESAYVKQYLHHIRQTSQFAFRSDPRLPEAGVRGYGSIDRCLSTSRSFPIPQPSRSRPCPISSYASMLRVIGSGTISISTYWERASQIYGSAPHIGFC